MSPADPPAQSNSPAPRLAGGDPLEGEPSTFSRFLLPVGLRPKRTNRNASPAMAGEDWHWAEAEKNDWLHAPAMGVGDDDRHLDLARRRYVTPETAATLYDQTRWLVLQPPQSTPSAANEDGTATAPASGEIPGASFSCPFREETLEVHLRAPSLVCFEWDEELPFRSRTEHLTAAMLVVEAWFEGEPSFDAVLQFNEQFRYWIQPWTGHWEKLGYGVFLGNLPTDAFVPGECPGPLGETPASRQAVDGYFRRWADLMGKNVFLESAGAIHQWELCGCHPHESDDCWHQHAGSFARGDMPPTGNPKDRGWAIHADDRAFTITCLVKRNSPEKEAAAKQDKPVTGDDPTSGDALERSIAGYAETGMLGPESGRWIKALNVDLPSHDADKGDQCTPFEQAWAEERTYPRWAQYQALYGASYHSFVMVAEPCAAPPTWHHFHQIYADQALLLLYVRTVLFRFRRKLSQRASQLHTALRRGNISLEETTRFRRDFFQLRREFDLFTDMYQFPTLSNQQQAVELYSLFRGQMDLDDLYGEVEKEIKSTEDLITAFEKRDWSRLGVFLSVCGFIGIPIGLFVSSLPIEWKTITVFILVMAIVIPAFLWSVHYLRNFWYPKLAACCPWLARIFQSFNSSSQEP